MYSLIDLLALNDNKGLKALIVILLVVFAILSFIHIVQSIKINSKVLADEKD